MVGSDGTRERVTLLKYECNNDLHKSKFLSAVMKIKVLGTMSILENKM